MGSCRCGGKTVKFTPGQVKKSNVKKASIKPDPNWQNGGQGKKSPEQMNAIRQATIKAHKNSAPCECTS